MEAHPQFQEHIIKREVSIAFNGFNVTKATSDKDCVDKNIDWLDHETRSLG